MLKNICLLALVLVFLGAPNADARFGGGRSFGARGSRSVAPRSGGSGFGSYGSSAPRAAPAPQPAAPMAPMNPPSYGGGGGFMRGMMGGIAGGFLGSMLFGRSGFGGYGGGGGGGIGLLEILLIGGILFFIFRMVMARAATGGPGPGLGYQQQNDYPNSYSNRPDLRVVPAQDAPASGEPAATEALRRSDPGFDPTRFKDSKVDEFFRIQAAWMQRDLSPVRALVSDEIWSQLESEVAGLKSAGRINHIENVAVRETELLEAWQESGREYVTMRFYANLLDYVTDEHTGAVVEGDKDKPVKFEEFWTYARQAGRPDSPWQLTAIEQKA
jgi:predicted lipid-binding transport protein (Tim44 family)